MADEETPPPPTTTPAVEPLTEEEMATFAALNSRLRQAGAVSAQDERIDRLSPTASLLADPAVAAFEALLTELCNLPPQPETQSHIRALAGGLKRLRLAVMGA